MTSVMAERQGTRDAKRVKRRIGRKSCPRRDRLLPEIRNYSPPAAE
jgi:hypothetical protein